MKIETEKIDGLQIAVIASEDIVIAAAEDGLDLLGNLYYQGFDKIILDEKNITPDFFNLKTGIAGDILQKFSNYRMGLAVIGNFEKHQGAIQDFIFESNRSGHVHFVSSKEEAMERFSMHN
ncbi:DUF4180 domain-containing protein [Dyadobacter sp. 32]|uniref:DUF4180 domain-containing protein n=1 Tax=Dyadobacter sp. 32 TaxID=538966 RepID=UPI0011ED9987